MSNLDDVGVRIKAEGAQEAKRNVEEFAGSLRNSGVAAQEQAKHVDTADQKVKQYNMSTKSAIATITGGVAGVAAFGFAISDLDKRQLAVTKSARLLEETEQKLQKALESSGKSSQTYRDALRDVGIAKEQLKIRTDDAIQAQISLGLQFANLAANLVPNMIKAIVSLTATKTLDTVATNVNTAAKVGNSGALGVNTVATNVNSAAQGAASLSMWRLNISMLANPLFAIPTAIAIAGAIALVATNTFGLKDALFGATEAVDANTGAMEKQKIAYDHMGNVLKDNSGILSQYTHAYEENTKAIDNNSFAVDRNVRARELLKKKNAELATQSKNDFLNPPWGITTIGTVPNSFRTVDSKGNVIPPELVPFFGLNTGLGQRTINPKTGEGMIKTYDSNGKVLYWESGNGTFYDTNGKPITREQVARITNKGIASKSGATSVYDFVTDPLTGIIKAIPKGAGGLNIMGSINDPANNYGQNSARIAAIGLEGAARDMAARIKARSAGVNLISAHLDPSSNSRLGGAGGSIGVGSIVSALGKAGINLAGTGFGRGTVGTAGGGRKKGRGRGNLNIRIVSNMIKEIQSLASTSLKSLVDSGLAEFLTDAESQALIALVNSAGSSVRGIQSSRASRGIYDARAAYFAPRSAAAAAERANINTTFGIYLSLLTERKGRFEHQQLQNARAMAELQKESQYSSEFLGATKDEIFAAMQTPEGQRDIRNMMAYVNVPLYRSIGT